MRSFSALSLLTSFLTAMSEALASSASDLAWRTQATPGYESDLLRIAVLERSSGERTLPSGDFDDWITGFLWAPDSRRILFIADVKGRTPLHEIDVATSAIREITAVGNIDAWAVSPDGTWAAVSRRQVGHPPELYRIAGVPTDYELSVSSFDDLLHPEDRLKLQALRQQTLADGVPRRQHGFRDHPA